MANWLKSFFKNPCFEGKLCYLIHPDSNVIGSTIFMKASLELKNQDIVINNLEFDPSQEQQKRLIFKKNHCSDFFHFTIDIDDLIVQCIKWTHNIQNTKVIYKFEFFKEYNKTDISKQFGVVFNEEGYEKSSLIPNLKSGKALYMASSLGSIININQIPPSPVKLEENIPSQLEFKISAIENLSHLYKLEQILYISAADLYLESELKDQGIGILLVKHDDFVFTLDLVRDNDIIMRILLNKYFYYKLDKKKKIFEFIELCDNVQRPWKALLTEDIFPLEGLLTRLLFESERKSNIDQALTQDEIDWLKQEDEEDNQSFSSDNSENYFEENHEKLLDEEITDSVQAINHEDIYVGHLNKISVYREGDSCINMNTNLPIVNKFEKENEFVPVMLLPKSQGMMMVNQLKPNNIYTMDLSKGVLKSSYHISNSSIQGITNTKTEETIDINAITHNQIFTIDPRVPKYVVQQYTYMKNPRLSSITTTSDGHLAIGNNNGEIRLYSKVGQKAKTCFPGFGHCVYSIDSTKDGKWIVATTETYLIVLPTSAYGINGYEKSITKKRRKARQLQIKPTDIVKYQLTQVKFTPARFNIGNNSEENAIISSIDNIITIWNFKSVKQGKTDNYKIRSLGQKIIKNEFLYGKDDAIVTYTKGLELQIKCKSSGKI